MPETPGVDSPGQVASTLASVSLRAGLVAVLADALGRMLLDRGWTWAGWVVLGAAVLAGVGGAAAAGLCLGHRPGYGGGAPGSVREPHAVRLDRATAWCGGGISAAAALVALWLYFRV